MKTVDYSKWPDISKSHPELKEEGEQLYASYMAARENFYHDYFGESFPDGKILSPSDPNIMLNWPGGGIYQFAPQKDLNHWHYVTHGLSQIHELKEAKALSYDDIDRRYSAWGFELVISTNIEVAWASNVLLNFVYHFLFDENARPFSNGSRIPCNGPLVLNTDTKLTYLLCSFSGEYPADVLLPGGHCEIFHLVGVTEDEIDRAKKWGRGAGGSLILKEVMAEFGIGTVTDPQRGCLTELPNFEEVWIEKQELLEQKWTNSGWNGEGKS